MDLTDSKGYSITSLFLHLKLHLTKFAFGSKMVSDGTPESVLLKNGKIDILPVFLPRWTNYNQFTLVRSGPLRQSGYK